MLGASGDGKRKRVAVSGCGYRSIYKALAIVACWYLWWGGVAALRGRKLYRRRAEAGQADKAMSEVVGLSMSLPGEGWGCI